MYILGISTYQRNSSAAILKDNQLLACIEEDRLIRKKDTVVFPSNAIKECLRIADIPVGAIEAVVLNHDPRSSFSLSYLRYAGSLRLLNSLIHRAIYFFAFARVARQELKKLFPAEFAYLAARMHYVQHHICHAASSYYLSGFENAAILSVDGSGESTTAVYARGQGRKIKVIKEIKFPLSLGRFYSALTDYLGFKPASAEGTVMAMAAYGRPTFADVLGSIVSTDANGKLHINLRFFNYFYNKKRKFSDKFVSLFGASRQPGSEIEQKHMDMAKSAQDVLENNVLAMLRFLKRKTAQENLCLSGGVFLNCVLNSKIKDSRIFKNIFLQPAVNDPGTAFGAAYEWYYRNLPGRPEVPVVTDDFLSPYQGGEYGNEEIELALEKHGLSFECHEDIAGITAGLLAQNKVIGWFQGKAEVGPRALGNRSILASPQNVCTRDRINFKIKQREWFRPFAPAVLDECGTEFFEDYFFSPYMLYSFRVKEGQRRKISACVHVDGSARLQSVSGKTNPLFYALLKEFFRLSGIPMLLNTSFNLRGQPIVHSPEDAISVFLSSPMDALVLGGYLVLKTDACTSSREPGDKCDACNQR